MVTRRFGIACWAVMTAFLCGAAFYAAAFRATAAGAAELRIGAAAVVITPPLGAPMAGYYHARGADGVLDDLYAKAMVVECGGAKAALVACDIIAIPRHTTLAARDLIAARTGIPATHVMISATHSHTGPVIDRDVAGTNERSAAYTARLPEEIAKAVAAADRRLAPAKLHAAAATEERISFNRRFWMKDGSVSWNPGKGDANIIRPAGPIDPEVVILYATTTAAAATTGADAPLAAYVNFAMHPDTTGGTRISADYPGVFARRLADVKGDSLVTLFANGCCGNINHLDNRWIAGQSSPAEAKRLGTALAGTVLAALPKLTPVVPAALRARSRVVPLPLAPITEADVQAAKKVVANAAGKPTFMEQVKALQVLDVAARKGSPLEAEVQVIALGDRVAWVSLPGEVFVELGLSIKRASPFRYTMIAELANGVVGYVPNKSAYPEGNYEVVSARCAAGSGEMLVAAAVAMLEELAAAK